MADSLPLGLSYPFDWGFVPSTQAPDGDPLDILILHEASTYPGVVLPCRPLDVVEMDQDEKEVTRERNDRVIVMPSWYDRFWIDRLAFHSFRHAGEESRFSAWHAQSCGDIPFYMQLAAARQQPYGRIVSGDYSPR